MIGAVATSILAAGVVSGYGYKKRSLSRSGAIGAFFVGFICFLSRYTQSSATHFCPCAPEKLYMALYKSKSKVRRGPDNVFFIILEANQGA